MSSRMMTVLHAHAAVHTQSMYMWVRRLFQLQWRRIFFENVSIRHRHKAKEDYNREKKDESFIINIQTAILLDAAVWSVPKITCLNTWQILIQVFKCLYIQIYIQIYIHTRILEIIYSQSSCGSESSALSILSKFPFFFVLMPFYNISKIWQVNQLKFVPMHLSKILFIHYSFYSKDKNLSLSEFQHVQTYKRTYIHTCTYICRLVHISKNFFGILNKSQNKIVENIQYYIKIFEN